MKYTIVTNDITLSNLLEKVNKKTENNQGKLFSVDKSEIGGPQRKIRYTAIVEMFENIK